MKCGKTKVKYISRKYDYQTFGKSYFVQKFNCNGTVTIIDESGPKCYDSSLWELLKIDSETLAGLLIHPNDRIRKLALSHKKLN